MSETNKENKLWGGRFTGTTDPLMNLYNSSISYDSKMYKEDLEGTRIYTQGLCKLNLITESELKAIDHGLTEIEKEWSSKTFVIVENDEDNQ